MLICNVHANRTRSALILKLLFSLLQLLQLDLPDRTCEPTTSPQEPRTQRPESNNADCHGSVVECLRRHWVLCWKAECNSDERDLACYISNRKNAREVELIPYPKNSNQTDDPRETSEMERAFYHILRPDYGS